MARWLRLGAPLWLAGCAGTSTVTPPDEVAPAVARCPPAGWLEVVPLDVWGRDLDAEVRFDRDIAVVGEDLGPSVRWVPLPATDAELVATLSAPDHGSVTARFDVAGGAVTASVTGDAWTTSSVDAREIGEEPCPVSTIYVGLPHRWFAVSGPAPTRNDAALLINGEAFWSAVASDLDEAKRRVTWATWWWESDFELVREAPPVASTSARAADTAMGRLEALDGVDRKVLVNRFWSENLDFASVVNTDAPLRAAAERQGDGLDVILQGNATDVPVFEPYLGRAPGIDFGARVLTNPRYADRDVPTAPPPPPLPFGLDAASWHQKLVVIDGEVAFVSGINVKADDWDTEAQAVFEPRRMPFDATNSERAAVADGRAETELTPRRDYGVRLVGPAVRDVEAAFHRRWEDALDRDALYADNATPFELDPAPPPVPDGVLAQVVVTTPEPWGQQEILDGHLRAIRQAEGLIFIEDQYFRSTILLEAIVARMREVPDLRLIVITLPVTSWDPGAKYTWLSHETLRSLYPNRYRLFQLRSSALVIDDKGVRYSAADVYTHSKLRVIDDAWLSVGSCNVNNRGLLYEGEMNVSVADRAFVGDARRRIFSGLLGEAWASDLTDDPIETFELFDAAARENDARHAWWTRSASGLSRSEAEREWTRSAPSGFLYPLDVSSDYLFDVGPDLF